MGGRHHLSRVGRVRFLARGRPARGRTIRWGHPCPTLGSVIPDWLPNDLTHSVPVSPSFWGSFVWRATVCGGPISDALRHCALGQMPEYQGIALTGATGEYTFPVRLIQQGRSDGKTASLPIRG